MTIARRTSMLLLSLAAAAIALLAAVGPALGGGFSTTTLDPLAAAPRAGTTLPVGYTVAMHGVTPVAAPGSGIAIVGPDGERTVFPGRPEGPVGHYVADVRFPSAGSWGWESVQDGVTLQELGAVEVAAGAGAAPPPAADPGDGPAAAAAWALLAATIAAAALLAAVALRPARPRAG
jgi:hypothetical protein